MNTRSSRRMAAGSVRFFFACAVLFYGAHGVHAQLLVTNNGDNGEGSLRLAIANAEPDDEITFAPGMSGQTIRLTSGELLINKGLTIDASNLAEMVTISGDANNNDEPDAGDSRVFRISAEEASIWLDSLVITEGYSAEGPGGGIFINAGSVHMSDCVISHNTVASETESAEGGGGIFITESQLVMWSCTVLENTAGDSDEGAGGNGGGILALSCDPVELVDCEFSSNRAGSSENGTGGNGGAICGLASNVILDGCLITDNEAGSSETGAGGSGGGIAGAIGLTMRYSTISGNRAGNGGGEVEGSSGGGLAILEGFVNSYMCTISENDAGTGLFPGVGGGIYLGASYLNMINSTVSGNDTAEGGPGGGIFADGDAQIALQHSTVADNEAGVDGSGGGICLSSAQLSMSHAVVARNTISGKAAGADIYRCECSMVGDFGPNFVGDNNTVEEEFPEGAPNENGDLAGTLEAPLDPVLGPLVSNGGPTRTHLPLAGSPLIDFSTEELMFDQFDLDNDENMEEPLPIDQRGFPRLFGAGVDLGAVEASASDVIGIPTLTDRGTDLWIGAKRGNQKGDNVYFPKKPGAAQTLRETGSVFRNETFSAYLTIENDGMSAGRFGLKASPRSPGNAGKVTVRVLGGGNVTAKVLSGRYQASLAPGKRVSLLYQIEAERRTAIPFDLVKDKEITVHFTASNGKSRDNGAMEIRLRR